jgi:hypothetical protein
MKGIAGADEMFSELVTLFSKYELSWGGEMFLAVTDKSNIVTAK